MKLFRLSLPLKISSISMSYLFINISWMFIFVNTILVILDKVAMFINFSIRSTPIPYIKKIEMFLFIFGVSLSIYVYIIYLIIYLRYFYRILPIDISDKISSIKLSTALYVAILFALNLYFFYLFLHEHINDLYIKSIQQYASVYDVLNYYFMIATIVIVIMLCIYLVIIHYIVIPKKQFRGNVLFLRRFSSFADRSIIGVILSKLNYKNVRFMGALLKRRRFVCLIPEDEPYTNLDPYIISIAGFKIKHPFLSTPIYIRASNVLWETTVHSLIDSASLIIIDLSDLSQSMKLELEFIYNKKKISITRFIVHKESFDKFKMTLERLGININTIDKNIVLYESSWLNAIGRIILEGLIVVYCYAVVFMTIDRMALPYGILIKFIMAVASIFYAISTFLKPSLSNKSKKDLKHMLQSS